MRWTRKINLPWAGFCVLLPVSLAVQAAPPAHPAATPAPACTTQGPIGDWNAAAQLIAGASNAGYAGSMTDEQKAEMEQNTGKSVDSIELSVEELEQRIAPRTLY